MTPFPRLVALAAAALLSFAWEVHAQPEPARWEVRGHRAPAPARALGASSAPAAPGFRGTLELVPAEGEGAWLVLDGRDERDRALRFEGRVEARRLDGGVVRYEGVVARRELRAAGAAGRVAGRVSAGELAQRAELVAVVTSTGVRGLVTAPEDGARIVRFESLPAATRHPIVLIHGAWVDARCWNAFRARYELAGYRVIAPDWPALGTADAGRIGAREIVDHYAAIVRGLEPAPILIGHSFGGLWVQELLDRGLGAVGVAIDSAPPAGVLLHGAAWKANLPAIGAAFTRGLFDRDLLLEMTFEEFAFGFVNRLGRAAQLAAYDRFVIPTPARVFRSVVSIDFDRAERAPLLLIAGSADNTITPEMVRAMHRRYTAHPRAGGPQVEYLELAGRTHWLIQEPGWEEVADRALEFAERALAPAARAAR